MLTTVLMGSKLNGANPAPVCTSDLLDKCLWMEHLASRKSRYIIYIIIIISRDILKLLLQRCELKRVFLAAVYQPDMMPGCRIYNLYLSFKYECIETQRQNISFSSPVKSDFRAFCAPLWVHWHSTGNCKHSHWINYQLFPPRSVWLLWKKGRLTVLNFGPHVESSLVSSYKENEREQVPGERWTHEKVIFRKPRSGEVMELASHLPFSWSLSCLESSSVTGTV